MVEEIKNGCQQKIQCIWQIVLNMKLLAINKVSSGLKIMRFKMPNAPYSNRYGQVKQKK